jgi:uncharacterized protein YkwD
MSIRRTWTLCAAILALPPCALGAEQRREATGPQAPQAAAAEGQASAAQRRDEQALRPIEANLVQYTNAQRAKFGLAALEIDPGLMDSARRHAAWMAGNGRLVHTSQPVAENIAMGQPHSSRAVGDWMNSSGHRANILNRTFRRIGVAAYRTASGTVFWCQQFR